MDQPNNTYNWGGWLFFGIMLLVAIGIGLGFKALVERPNHYEKGYKAGQEQREWTRGYNDGREGKSCASE